MINYVIKVESEGYQDIATFVDYDAAMRFVAKWIMLDYKLTIEVVE